MDLYLGTTTNKIYLNGASMAAPVIGANFVLKTGTLSPRPTLSLPLVTAGEASGVGELVQDMLTVNLVESDSAAIDDWMASIERMIEAAKLWQARRVGLVVCLGCQVDGADGYWLAPVLDGWIEQVGAGVADRSAGSLSIRLHLIRKNWWEADSPTAVHLTNLQGSEQSMLTVYNHNDTGHSSYVGIDGAEVLGSLPARTIVLYHNAMNDGLAVRNLYISHNAWSAPSVLSLILEGDNGTGGVKTADSSCSNGFYQAITWSGAAAALLEYWTIAGADVDRFAGTECHAVARLKNTFAYTDLWFQWQVQSGTTMLWQSPWMLGIPGQALQDLPMTRIPPWFLNGIYPSRSLKLCLYARRDAGGSMEIDLDFVQLMPQDGYRKLEAVYPAPYDFDLQDDGYFGVLATINELGGAGVLATHVGRGKQIMLIPGIYQRLYFLLDNDDLSAAIDRAGTVVVQYYPRVRSF
jgi:hypothetical protein